MCLMSERKLDTYLSNKLLDKWHQMDRNIYTNIKVYNYAIITLF